MPTLGDTLLLLGELEQAEQLPDEWLQKHNQVRPPVIKPSRSSAASCFSFSVTPATHPPPERLVQLR